MTLKERLNQEMKQAMKARDSLRLTTIRMILTAVKNREIEQKKELDDREVTAVLSTMLKQRREAADAYRKGNATSWRKRKKGKSKFFRIFFRPSCRARKSGKSSIRPLKKPAPVP